MNVNGCVFTVYVTTETARETIENYMEAMRQRFLQQDGGTDAERQQILDHVAQGLLFTPFVMWRLTHRCWC